MNRYEEIFMRLVAAEIASSTDDTLRDAQQAAHSWHVEAISAAAATIEAHFEARENRLAVEYFEKMRSTPDSTPALLKPQAE
jgi:hypothetical protein